MEYHLLSTDKALDELGTTYEGLTSEEAAKRLAEYGPNQLQEGKKATFLQRVISQLSDPMVLVLIGAAVVSGITSWIQKEVPTDVFVILAVVILNTVLGVLQESKAEKAIDALKKMSASTSKVLRDGWLKVLPSTELVPGDVVLLEAGDAIPADGRILEAASLKTEESALTGESLPVNKISDIVSPRHGDTVPLGDRRNMCYMGSCAVYGRGKVVITGTGMKTEMGKIATAISEAEDGDTPLQKKLAQLSKILTWLVLGICVFMFVFALIRNGEFSGGVILNTFMLAVSLAVAAIPEGLAAVVTIVLSMGVTKMSARNAIIRRLTAVETLGCTQIICSDKTGTLTQNVMTVVESYGDKKLLAEGMTLCSDAIPDETGKAQGEPTECALVNFATAEGILKVEALLRRPRVSEAPFDSLRKMMSTIHDDGDGIIQFTKGAPDEILARCTSYIEKGTVYPMTDEKRREISDKNREFGSEALRVLACAFRKYTSVPVFSEPCEIENELTFIGLCGMIDPVRPEVTAAVAECVRAGIRPIMITGDHIITAVAIAKKLGIITDASQAIFGAELDKLSDDELDQVIEKYSVYARVQPEHKVRIVNAWRRKNCITAMTGDGVNDAPSIKSADIGVGMGITGTDVTKNVADMILSDDNFATIVSAVGEGRRIYDNISKCIRFLLSSNLSEVISIFVATLLGFTILKPVHLLFINLVTDSLPALALGAEEADPGIMERRPRPSNEGIFANGVGFDIFWQGLMISAITVVSYLIGHFLEAGVWQITDSADGMTMAFLTMSMAEIFHAYNMRSDRSLFTIKTHNKLLLLTMIASLVLTAAVVFIPPLASLFGFEIIDLGEYAVALGLALLVIPITELAKLIKKLAKKK